MRKFFRKMFSSLGTSLIGIHLVGVGISFTVFSYQYAREHGFMSWLIFGEVVPALKSVVWEVFLVLALIQSPVQSPPITSITQDFWWMSEYSALVRTVNTADSSSLSTSYRTGPEGKREVKLSLLTTSVGGLILKTEIPKESVFSVDPETGEKMPSAIAPVITIRDHNLDGVPDDFYMEPGEPSYEEEFTKDGFIKFRDTLDHQFVLIKWSIGIGFCVNYFLHGVNSAFPRQINSSVTDQDELTGYWWNNCQDSEKLSYIVGLVDGLNFATTMATPLVYLGLHLEEIADRNKDEEIELWKQRASEFTKAMKCIGEFSDNELKQDLNEYYKADENREISVVTAIRILEIEPRMIPDWMLEQRINELKTLSDERYEYLKKKYLKEKLRRKT